MQAQTLMESRRYGEVESVVEAGLAFLIGLPEEETSEVAAQLAAVRVEAAKADAEEKAGAKIRAAERELNVAREDIEKGNVLSDSIDFRFDKAIGYMEGVPAELQAPLLDQIEMMKAILAAREGRSTVSTNPVQAPAAPAPTADQQANLSRAKGRINQARSLIETGRTEGVDGLLDDAAGLLAGAPEDDRDALLTDIEALRAEIVVVEQAEYARRIGEEFNRHLHEAENIDVWRAHDSARAIAYLTERIGEEKGRGKMPAEVLAGYEQRVAAATVRRAAMLKENALERGMPLLTELEQGLVTDPFEGLDDSAAYRATQDLEVLRDRARHEVRELPQDDPDVVSFNARLDAATAKIEECAQRWGLAKFHDKIRLSWDIVANNEEIAGWREEVANDEPRLLEVPSLPRTRTAVMRIGWLLHDDETVSARAEHPDDEVVRSTYQRAEEEQAAAVAKLSEAYHAVLALAEQAETPTRSDDLYKTGHFATAVQSSFEGTTALEALLERTTALEKRWEAEVAAIKQGRQDLYDRLAVEADKDWPAIVAATGAEETFDPLDPVGKVVHLSGVYNRSGWDFNNYDFCMRWDGVPVGGSYESYVLQALEHAWYELKLDVNDRITWDLVGIVQGGGRIGERTKVSVRGSNGLEIGTVEEWPSVECVRLKIIALHAGPVAVGPDHPWKPEA